MLHLVLGAIRGNRRIFFMGRPIYRIEHIIEDLYIGIPKRTNNRIRPRAFGLCLEASGASASLNDFKITEQRFFEDIERYRPSSKDVVIAVDDGTGDISSVIKGLSRIGKKYKAGTAFVGRQRVVKNGCNVVFTTHNSATQGDNILSVIDHLIMTAVVFSSDLAPEGLIWDYFQILHGVVARTVVPESLLAGSTRGRIYLTGNGGSAAMSSNAGYVLNKHRVSARALTNERQILNTSSTRKEYEQVFARQLDDVRVGDVLIGISTSGNADNVLKGMARARQRGAGVIGLTAFDGGEIFARYRDRTIVVPITCYGARSGRLVSDDSDTAAMMHDYSHGEDMQNLILMFFVEERIREHAGAHVNG